MKMTTDLLGKWTYASIGPMADVKDARSDEARTKETRLTSWKVLEKGTLSRSTTIYIGLREFEGPRIATKVMSP
jgi:hypothetical protein